MKKYDPSLYMTDEGYLVEIYDHFKGYEIQEIKIKK